MSKHIQLSIPIPCHEDWDKMNPVEKDRFCDSCQKKVIDFSNMSDREIATFFKKSSSGSVCGRFMEDQLERTLEIPKKRIPWLKYFFQFTIPAFLVSMKISAQKERPLIGKIAATCIRPLIGDTTIISNKEPKNEIPQQEIIGNLTIPILIESIPVTGKVIDENGAPISSAIVSIKGTKTATTSDASGNFQLNVDKKEYQITLVASYVGFNSVEKVVNLTAEQSTNIILKTSPTIGGEVVVVAGYVVRKKPKSELKNVPLLKQTKDTVSKVFKVFPNPIKSNSSLNIETEKLEAGSYSLQLFNLSGQLIFTKEIYIDDEARVLNIQLPSISAGTYFLRMTNKQSGKNSTEKIIIQ